MNLPINTFVFAVYLKSVGLETKDNGIGVGWKKRLRSTALEFLDSCESERLSPENHSRPNFPRQQARNNGFTAR